jgi:hypothetical protein
MPLNQTIAPMATSLTVRLFRRPWKTRACPTAAPVHVCMVLNLMTADLTNSILHFVQQSNPFFTKIVPLPRLVFAMSFVPCSLRTYRFKEILHDEGGCGVGGSRARQEQR